MGVLPLTSLEEGAMTIQSLLTANAALVHHQSANSVLLNSLHTTWQHMFTLLFAEEPASLSIWNTYVFLFHTGGESKFSTALHTIHSYLVPQQILSHSPSELDQVYNRGACDTHIFFLLPLASLISLSPFSPSSVNCIVQPCRALGYSEFCVQGITPNTVVVLIHVGLFRPPIRTVSLELSARGKQVLLTK